MGDHAECRSDSLKSLLFSFCSLSLVVSSLSSFIALFEVLVSDLAPCGLFLATEKEGLERSCVEDSVDLWR